MGRVCMLDCTLRDGGWVNRFCFGSEAMQGILGAMECAGVEYVELGYLDAGKGSPVGRSEYADTEAIQRNLLLEEKKSHVTYLAMIDYGKFPIERLPVRTQDGIDGIRLCFHKKDAQNAMGMGQKILEKGYLLMMQPMVCMRYTDSEFEGLIQQMKERLEGMAAFYIVDSFGSMNPEDIRKRAGLADGLLPGEAGLGLHTHNNMQLSFQNAAEALRMGMRRNLIIDGTLFGIGKGAGNLNIETFAEYLNQNYGKHYSLAVMREAAEGLAHSMQPDNLWGYRAEYYLSAKHSLTPSYAEMFCRGNHLNMEEVDALLAQVPDEKKDSFDRIVAERILWDYMQRGKSGKE